jgi:hypothetical protein
MITRDVNIPSSLITITSIYTAWQTLPAVSRAASLGVGASLRNFENSSWRALRAYGFKKASKSLQTNLRGNSAFFLQRHMRTLKRRMDSSSSRGSESMARRFRGLCSSFCD